MTATDRLAGSRPTSAAGVAGRSAAESMTPPPQLVIFDVDGVLVDSDAIANNVLASPLSTGGLATSAEDARAEYPGLLLPKHRVFNGAGLTPDAVSVLSFATSAHPTYRRRLRSTDAAGANRSTGSCKHESGHDGVDVSTAAVGVTQPSR